MVGRTVSSPLYRYGFNGKEKDDEAKGSGVQYDYGFRIYDPRMGRFLSVDPLQVQYPSLTPYQYTSNNPVAGTDLDGREFEWYLAEKLEKKIFGTAHLKNIRVGFTEQAVKTVRGIVGPPDVSKSVINQFIFDPRTTLSDPTIAKKNTQQLFKIGQDLSEIAQNSIGQMAKEYADLAAKATKGDMKAVGALGFEAAMIFLPGGEGANTLKFASKELKYLKEVIPVAERTVLNAEGKANIRHLVRNEDELLKVAENAAGGSLDKFDEIKPGRWMGEIEGKKLKIEWEPGGHNSTNEGPHVRIQEWIEGGGKRGRENGVMGRSIIFKDKKL